MRVLLVLAVLPLLLPISCDSDTQAGDVMAIVCSAIGERYAECGLIEYADMQPFVDACMSAACESGQCDEEAPNQGDFNRLTACAESIEQAPCSMVLGDDWITDLCGDF